MRNIFKFGIIALVVVIGIGLAGCPTEDDGDSGGGGGGGGGELTITGLANDNGKYAIVAGDDKIGDEYLIGGTFSAENVTGVKIEVGSVKLPVYIVAPYE